MLCCSCGPAVFAQGFFNQKGAMIKKGIEQIALLQTYAAFVKKGYHIVENGVGTIHDLKNGELGLHTLFYTGLDQVNPQIKKYPLAKDCQTLYNKMLKEYQKTWQDAIQGGQLSSKETEYLQGVYDNLFKAAKADMEDLDNTITDGKYKMKDDERIRRLDDIHKRLLKKYKVLHSLNLHVSAVVKGRAQQQDQAEGLKKLYGQKK